MKDRSLDVTHNIVNVIVKLSVQQRRFLWNVMDAIAYTVSSIIAYIAFIDIIRPEYHYYLGYTLIALIIYWLILRITRLSRHITRYFRLSSLFKIGMIAFGSSFMSGFLSRLIFDVFPLRFMVLSALASSVIVVSYRILWQLMYASKPNVATKTQDDKKVIVIGAGDGGSIFMENHMRDPSGMEIQAILDNDPRKIGTNISGVPVIGPVDQLPCLLQDWEIDEVVIAIPSLGSDKIEAILKMTEGTNVEVFHMPPVEEIIQGHQYRRDVKKIDIADLLGRQEVSLDDEKIRDELEGKNILITGAGGSIGSEIVRQVSKYNPRKIVLFGHGENSIYLLQRELLQRRYHTIQYVPVIADIQNYERVLEVFQAEQPDIIYHAAAHKHVPLMEENVREAVYNNIYGTYNVAKAVDAVGADKMVMISTDKAVNPPNVMGATKRVAELLVTGMNQVSESKFTAVRFGNVLGSRGSVIPVFQQQIEAGGPVTVTDFRMTRYFMTIPEASRLVIYAGVHAKGGEVFVLDMGEPVKIYDLAKKMILLSGHTTGDIEIIETGIRPGEKLYEELITADELVDGKIHEKIFLGQVSKRPLQETEKFINDLRTMNIKSLKKVLIDFANDHS